MNNITDVHLIIAGTRGGKSTLVQNLVRKIIYHDKRKKIKDMVFLFNNNAVAQNWINKDYVFEYDVNKLKEINSEIHERKIIIIEDCLSQLTTMKQKKELEGILSLHRHHNTHYIIVSQSYIGVPLSIRSRELSSNTHMYIAKQRQRQRIQALYDSCDCWDDMQYLIDDMDRLKKYEFLYISPDDLVSIVKSDPKKTIRIDAHGEEAQ